MHLVTSMNLYCYSIIGQLVIDEVSNYMVDTQKLGILRFLCGFFKLYYKKILFNELHKGYIIRKYLQINATKLIQQENDIWI